MKIAGMVVLAALTGWFMRGIRFEEPTPQPAVVIAQSPSEPVVPTPVIARVPATESSLRKRNLFAYRTREEPVIVTPPAVVMAATTLPPVPVVVEAPAPQPIPFPWRYIGTFGPAHNSVAAFKRDEEIVTMKAGERIGDFTLRRIGIESVEVDGPDGLRRIPLSSAV